MSEREPTLIIGAGGMLGRALVRELERSGREVLAWTRTELELTDPHAIDDALRGVRPAAVLNAAAWNDVDGAELPGNRGELYAVNRDAPARLAARCASAGVPFVHVSTDYVFDGAAREPYAETDPTAPLQQYGASKLAGERAVAEAYPDALVARTSTVFGPGRRTPHFVGAILAQARRRDVIEVAELPTSAPTYAPDLASMLLSLIERGCRGLVHVVNSGSCSRLELARAAVSAAGHAGRVEVRQRPPQTGGVPRPAYSVLGTSRLTEMLGRAPRRWEEAVQEYVEAYER